MTFSLRSLVPANRNASVLAICQGLYTAALAIDLTLTGLTGYQLAPDKSLATLPFALITVAGAIVTFFASFLLQRIGRRLGFMLGSITGAIGGLISYWSVVHENFWTFCLGTAAVGVFQAFASYYRLAAADAVPVHDKARAISIVMAGGVIAAVLGPVLASWSKDLLPTLFAGSYLMVCVLGLASALLLAVGYNDKSEPVTTSKVLEEPQRGLGEIFAQPISLAAIANNVIGGVVMIFVMTAAPLAAVSCNHTIDDGANIIQWHLVGMYAPSFFVGMLIKRFGLPRTLFLGMALSAACSFVAVTSTSLVGFYVALLCLGIGWNFMFVGGTALLAQSYRPSERAKVQGWSEMIRSGFTALASLAAGPFLETFGWERMNLTVLPAIILAAVMTWSWVRHERMQSLTSTDQALGR